MFSRPSKPSVVHSIIILAHKLPTLLHECLESISHANIPGNFEVIVVNDGGPQEINHIAESFLPELPVTCLRLASNSGISHARNVGIKASSGSIITIFADNYTIEKDHFIRKEALLKRYGVVSSRVITVGKGMGPKMQNLYYQFIIDNWKKGAQQVEEGFTGPGFPAGAASSFRRETLEVTGAFDEELVAGEDSDYNKRMDDQGIQRLHADAIHVYRREEITFWQILKKQYTYGAALFDYRERSGYQHMIKYELSHAQYVVSLYLDTTGKFRNVPFVALLHGAFRWGIVLGILKKRWRERKLFRR